MPPLKPATPVLNTVDSAATSLLMAVPFSDGTGSSPVDISGNSYVNTIFGTTSWFNDPQIGTVLQLDGTSGYVALDTAIEAILSAQSTATVAFWLKLRNNVPGSTAKAGLCTIQSLSGLAAATLYPSIDGKMYSSVFRQTTRVNAITLGGVDKSQWHHLAITQVSNGNYIVYQNGVAVSTTSGEFGVSALLAPFVGKSTDAGGDYFLDGWLGDFRVWTRLLVGTEILTLFNNPWALYTPSAQQGQVKIFDTQAEASLEYPATARVFETQTEGAIHPATNMRAEVVMADITVNTTFPYSITDGQDARYKPVTPILVPDTVTSGLTFAIPFTEGSGLSAADYSGSGANGTLTNGVTWQADTTSPFFRPALTKAPDVAFPNPTSHVQVPAGAAVEPASAFSLAAWVVVGTNTGTNMTIMSKVNDLAGSLPNAGATWSYILWQRNDQKFALQVSDVIDSSPADVVVSVNAFGVGQLCYVVATYDTATQLLKMYVNGKFEAQTANSGTVPYNSNGTHALFIGSDESVSDWRWPGRIDDVRIWNRALTAAEILQLYSGPFGIYGNYATMRTLGTQIEAALEYPATVRVFEAQVEAEPYPSTYLKGCVVMADMVPAIHNSNFGVISVSPVVGPPAGGTLVTIRGYNLSGTNQILVGGVPLTSLTIVNNSTVTGVTGAHVPGLVDTVVTVTNLGQLTLPSSFAYAPGFTPTANLGLIGAQLDTGIILDPTFVGETTPSWPGSDTTLSFTLPDVPVSPACVDLYIRRTGQQGAMWLRQGSIYAYTVDLANKKIIWKTTAPFTLLSSDEITVVFLAQGN